MSVDDTPDLSRFSRDPALREPALRSVQEAYAAPRRDPYRDRNVLGGLALVIALLSIPGTVVVALLPVDDIVGMVVGGAPIGFAILGLVASYKMGYSTRMAWAAIVISVITMAAGWAIDAQRVSELFPSL